MLRLLPWEYGVRNLLRRPLRTGLTLVALTVVVLLVLVVVGFVRGLDSSLASSGDPQVVLVYSLGAGENIENSSISAATAGLLAASVPGVRRRQGVACVSPELLMAVRLEAGSGGGSSLGLVRGVTHTAPLVRRRVQLVEGRWPGAGEVMCGRLAHAKLGCRPDDLAVGGTVHLEGKPWRVSGRFVAAGSAIEAELWCRLDDLAQATRRQDVGLVAVLMEPGAKAAAIDLFCKRRTDLELQSVRQSAYYAALARHYRPVKALAWVVVGLVAAAGLLAGLNTMYGAVAGRIRELATLQAVGFRRRAILIGLVQEGAVLAATASLAAGALALGLVHGTAVRFTMGAFTLRIDATGVLVGCGTGLALGVLGALPPAIRAMRLPVAESIKAVA